MLNNCFDGNNYYPEVLRADIDEINNYVYDKINNGVYKSGFAKSQSACDENVTNLFEGLEKIESILNNSRYLVGSTFTIADIRLFTTLIRFDAAYYGHFKCNLKRIADYPNLLIILENYIKCLGLQKL